MPGRGIPTTVVTAQATTFREATKNIPLVGSYANREFPCFLGSYAASRKVCALSLSRYQR